MNRLTTQTLIEAKEATAALLDRLLDAYLFEIELRDGGWCLRLDAGDDSGWQSFSFPVDIERLLGSRTSEPLRAQLLAEWGNRIRPESSDSPGEPGATIGRTRRNPAGDAS